jgi:hypothetical protein
VTVIWLNATVGAGKSAVGQALARLSPANRFIDGDDLAGPRHLPNPVRWRMAFDLLLRAAARRGHCRTLVVAYPLDRLGYRKLRAVCARAHRPLVVVNLATPLPIILRGRGGRRLDAAERGRVRVMRSKGYHRQTFATATLPNAYKPAARTARQIAGLAVRMTRRSASP